MASAAGGGADRVAAETGPLKDCVKDLSAVAGFTVAVGDCATKTFFQSFTQTGCTRNMHFSYKVRATEFGQRKGCLFHDLGCRGPMHIRPVQQDTRRHAVHGLHRA